MWLLLASLLLPVSAHAEEPSVPFPRIHTLYLPVVTRVRPVTIEGRNFSPDDDAPFEVRIGGEKVAASRVSDGEIRIPADTIGGLYRTLGKATSKELPVKVRVNGLESNVALLALFNTLPGDIQGRIELKGAKIPLTGARISIPERRLRTEFSPSGTFTLRQLPPNAYKLKLEWPAITADKEVDVRVLPGQTVAAEPFQVEVPKPELKSLSPRELKESEPLLLSGTHFLHAIKAPYEVRLGSVSLKANRSKNGLVIVPPESLAPFFRDLRDGEKREMKAEVRIAGVPTNALAVTLFKPMPPPPPSPPPRELAATPSPTP